MSQMLKSGDRVRLVTPRFSPKYRPGDTGVVESGPYALPTTGNIYVVRVEKDGLSAARVVFFAPEIEAVKLADPEGGQEQRHAIGCQSD